MPTGEEKEYKHEKFDAKKKKSRWTGNDLGEAKEKKSKFDDEA